MEKSEGNKRDGYPNSTPVAKVCKQTKEVIGEKINGFILIRNLIVIIREIISIIKIDKIQSGKYE